MAGARYGEKGDSTMYNIVNRGHTITGHVTRHIHIWCLFIKLRGAVRDSIRRSMYNKSSMDSNI
jgi:hypothetical protein